MSIYQSIITGLNEAIEYNEGKRQLKMTTLTVQPLPEFTPQEIKGIRQSVGVSQVLFAGIMGVSPKTVEAWEAGRNQPEGSSRRLLSLFQSDPSTVQLFSLTQN